MESSIYPRRTVRSFVRREGRLTQGQRHALETLWPCFGIRHHEALRQRLIEHQASPTVLDIGFGNGEALVQMAMEHSNVQFVGVEVYRPGIGNLLRLLDANAIENVSIIAEDAVTVLTDWLEPDSLQGCTIWFPDPWPKARHHKRRLLTSVFVDQLSTRLAANALLHLATDWPDYADWIDRLMQGRSDFAPTSADQHQLHIIRPQTKFERRGLRQGNPARDFIYRVKKPW